ADQRLHAKWVCIDEHRAGANFAAFFQDDPARGIALDDDRGDRLTHDDAAAVARQGVRQDTGDRAYSALDDHPGTVAAGQTTHVVDQEIHAGARRVVSAVQPR